MSTLRMKLKGLLAVDTIQMIMRKKHLHKIILLLMFLTVLVGCATDGDRGATQTSVVPTGIDTATAEDIAALKEQLIDMADAVDRAEAHKVAEAAIIYSQALAARYQVVRPAVWHNILVRVGVRDRGLCYHWTTDLMRKLQTLDLASFDLYWGVAHRGSELREHNSVVISARGQVFESGIVLDPWRHSGDLYWAEVSNDRFPWRELPRNMWF